MAALREGTRFVYDVVLRIGATDSPLGHATTLRIEQDIRYVRWGIAGGCENEMPKILLAGAAGRVARHVAAALCGRSEPPRALVRNATKARDVLVDNRGGPLPLELVVSKLDDRDGVRRALGGIEIAFLALGSSVQQVELEQRLHRCCCRSGLATPREVIGRRRTQRRRGLCSSLACRNRVTSRGKRRSPHPTQTVNIRRCAHVGRAVDTRDWPMVGERAARPQRPDRLGRRRWRGCRGPHRALEARKTLRLDGTLRPDVAGSGRSPDAGARPTNPLRCGIDRGTARAARGGWSRFIARRARSRTGRDQPIGSSTRHRQIPCDSLPVTRPVPSKSTSSVTAQPFPDPERPQQPR